jgi:hypothetical protein
MFITTRTDYEFITNRYGAVAQWFEWYVGPVAECKGDQTLKQSEMISLQNQTQQMEFSKQLMGVFEKQYGDQKEVLDYLKAKMQPMIDNPTGYSEKALAAMRTSATDNLSASYQNAQKALQADRFAGGGRDLPSGVDAQLNAALLQSEATDKAGAQNNITLEDENLKQGNYWNAINVLNGVGAQFNPQSYAGASTGASSASSSAGDATANIGKAYKESQKSQLLGALGGLASTGMSLFGAGCWVAAAAFDEDFETGPNTNLVRAWLWTTWIENWYAKPVLWLYSKIGRWVAKQRLLVWALKPLFELALYKARQK